MASPFPSWWAQRVRENPDVDGVILVNHGLFTWGDSARMRI